jgi:hypothetical protein
MLATVITCKVGPPLFPQDSCPLLALAELLPLTVTLHLPWRWVGDSKPQCCAQQTLILMNFRENKGKGTRWIFLFWACYQLITLRVSLGLPWLRRLDAFIFGHRPLAFLCESGWLPLCMPSSSLCWGPVSWSFQVIPLSRGVSVSTHVPLPLDTEAHALGTWVTALTHSPPPSETIIGMPLHAAHACFLDFTGLCPGIC